MTALPILLYRAYTEALSANGEPDILLTHEMIETGDAQFIEKAKARAEELIEISKVFVFASHNEDVLRKFCNKAILLENGSVGPMGSVDEVFAACHSRAGS